MDIQNPIEISPIGKFNKWDLDYKGERGDRTGPNILFKALSELSFYDKQKDVKISRKSVPTDPRGFAILNPVEQSHLIAAAFY